MAGKIRVTPEEFAEKHARRLKGSIQDIQTGIERVTEAPTAKAAAKQQKMLQNLQEAVQSGKWADGLKRVSLEEWKTKIIEKGLPRIAAGVDASFDKQVRFAQQLLAHEAELKAKIDQMPDLTLQDSINRATAWIQGMSKFRRK